MALQSLQGLAHHFTEKLQLDKLWASKHDIFLANYHLGFTSFGGPNVHFQIVRERDSL